MTTNKDIQNLIEILNSLVIPKKTIQIKATLLEDGKKYKIEDPSESEQMGILSDLQEVVKELRRLRESGISNEELAPAVKLYNDATIAYNAFAKRQGRERNKDIMQLLYRQANSKGHWKKFKEDMERLAPTVASKVIVMVNGVVQ